MHRAVRRGEPFRLVLLDQMMPTLDGFDLAERIRQYPSLTTTTLIMLSSAGYDNPGRARQLSIARTITKPAKQSELLQAICVALGVSPSESAAVKAETSPAMAPSRHVLLAEDGIVNQKVVVGLLEKHGHSVRIANNGREAVAASAAEPFDVILMDVQMPEMDGYQATAEIRARERSTGKHARIIALTAHAMKGDREKCLLSGMDGYLPKPIDASDLYEAIEGAGTGHVVSDDQGADTTATARALLNMRDALKRVGGNQEALSDLVELFHKECPKQLEEIHSAFSAGNARRLQRAAHTLKGSAAIFGAERTVDAAFAVESLGREGNLDSAADAIQVLEEELAELRKALAELPDQ
jgi:CheY-like chemotaxis protein